MDTPRISPEVKRRRNRLGATVAMASLAILSACGGGASADRETIKPTTTEASPSEVPNTDTVETVPANSEDQPSEIVETVPANSEENSGEEALEPCDDLHCPGVFHTPEFPSDSESMPDAEKAQRVIDALFENINFGINNNSPIHIQNSIGPDASGFRGTALETMEAVNAYRLSYPDTEIDEVYRIQAEVLSDPVKSPSGYAVEIQEYEDRDPLSDELLPLGEPFQVVLSRVDITYNSTDTETSMRPSWVFNGNIRS
jgi:hypothetical protein